MNDRSVGFLPCSCGTFWYMEAWIGHWFQGPDGADHMISIYSNFYTEEKKVSLQVLWCCSERRDIKESCKYMQRSKCGSNITPLSSEIYLEIWEAKQIFISLFACKFKPSQLSGTPAPTTILYWRHQFPRKRLPLENVGYDKCPSAIIFHTEGWNRLAVMCGDTLS